MQNGKKKVEFLRDFKDGGGSLKISGDDTINWCYESIDFPWFFWVFFILGPLQEPCWRERD